MQTRLETFVAGVKEFNNDAWGLEIRRGGLIADGRSCGLKLSTVIRMLAKIKVVQPLTEPELPLADLPDAPDIGIPDYLRKEPKP